MQEGFKRAAVKPTSEELQQLTEKSPIRYIDRITAPMFFMLGAKASFPVDSHRIT